MAFEIQDYPMYCCGMALACGISQSDYEDTVIEEGEDVEYEENWFTKTLDRIEKHQKDYRRNCAMITLSDYQQDFEIGTEELEKRGWKRIQTVYNPNSLRNFHIWVHILWEDDAAYRDAERNGYTPPPRINYTGIHHNPANLDSIRR